MRLGSSTDYTTNEETWLSCFLILDKKDIQFNGQKYLMSIFYFLIIIRPKALSHICVGYYPIYRTIAFSSYSENFFNLSILLVETFGAVDILPLKI